MGCHPSCVLDSFFFVFVSAHLCEFIRSFNICFLCLLRHSYTPSVPDISTKYSKALLQSFSYQKYFGLDCYALLRFKSFLIVKSIKVSYLMWFALFTCKWNPHWFRWSSADVLFPSYTICSDCSFNQLTEALFYFLHILLRICLLTYKPMAYISSLLPCFSNFVCLCVWACTFCKRMHRHAVCAH